MKLLIIYFSYTGNNKLLAEHIGRTLDAHVVGVQEKRKRMGLTMLLDMVFKRAAKIQPLTVSPREYEHVLFIAPLWDMNIAFPMKAAIEQLRDSLSMFSFISFCGYARAGQVEHVQQELNNLVGQAPQQVWELHVSELFPPEKRNKVTIVTPHKVTPGELMKFQTQIDEILLYFKKNR